MKSINKELFIKNIDRMINDSNKGPSGFWYDTEDCCVNPEIFSEIKQGIKEHRLVNLEHDICMWNRDIMYYDDEGKCHLYYFDLIGKCVVDIDVIQCDVNGATLLMNDRMEHETAPLINHFKEGNRESYVYMQTSGYNNIYGRLFEKNISSNGWHTFSDIMFNMDYYDLLSIMIDLESLIYY